MFYVCYCVLWWWFCLKLNIASVGYTKYCSTFYLCQNLYTLMAKSKYYNTFEIL